MVLPTKKLIFLTFSKLAPVRQRAGLGFPPERFTTNRSEQANRSIQEFVRKECNEERKVDDFSFCGALNMFVNMQKQEIELAIVGKGGRYKIRDKFQHLNVPPEKWNKMNEKQKRLQWKRFILSHIRRSNVSVLNKSVNDGENPICTEMVDAGVDWIPRTILDALVEKAVQQNASTAVPSNISNHVFSNSNGSPTSSREQLYFASNASVAVPSNISNSKVIAATSNIISTTTNNTFAITTSYLPKSCKLSSTTISMFSKSKHWAISHLFITVLPKANIDVFRMWTTTKERYSNTNSAQRQGHCFKDDKRIFL